MTQLHGPGSRDLVRRGGVTTYLQDLQHADCVLIQGSFMAEAHPVGFRWALKAKERGAKVIHVDPRFSRTSALADQHVPIRAGTDIAFLGGLIRHVVETESYFREYVVNYTNASTIIDERFRDAEELGGVFSGFDPQTGRYNRTTWMYEGGEMPAPVGVREHATQAFSIVSQPRKVIAPAPRLELLSAQCVQQIGADEHRSDQAEQIGAAHTRSIP